MKGSDLKVCQRVKWFEFFSKFSIVFLVFKNEILLQLGTRINFTTILGFINIKYR